MIIENKSEKKYTFGYRHGERTELVIIPPKHKVYIDESNWDVREVNEFYMTFKNDREKGVVDIRGNRKTRPIFAPDAKKEEFVEIDRYSIMEVEDGKQK